MHIPVVPGWAGACCDTGFFFLVPSQLLAPGDVLLLSVVLTLQDTVVLKPPSFPVPPQNTQLAASQRTPQPQKGSIAFSQLFLGLA